MNKVQTDLTDALKGFLPVDDWVGSANAKAALERQPKILAGRAAIAQAESDEFVASPEEIERARNDFCLSSNDEIEVDEGAAASRGDDGLWVAAWVWLGNEEEETAP